MKDKKAIRNSLAPEASGPYSQAVVLQSPQKLVFVSGQLPIDLSTGKLAVEEIGAMTRRILKSIEAILKEAGATLEDVVRVEIFCKELKRDFAEINKEYALHFTGAVKPARQTVEVACLPMDSPLEISCIAAISSPYKED